MKVSDVLLRDPAQHPLVNNGQARIADASDRALQELEGELRTFVCEGQYADGIQSILESFLKDRNRTSQRAAWVSGFFGSGKSHLLKMLCHLWRDTEFPDGSTARSLVPGLPDEIRALLRELDIAGRQGGGLVAAAGSLPTGMIDQVRLTILAVLFKGVGLPELYPQACFCLWLHEQGWFESVRQAVEATGKNFPAEINNLYVSNLIAKAILAQAPGFAPDEAEAKKQLRAQFPPQQTDISSDEFLRTFKAALKLVGRSGKLPCTLLVLDEVQQYIGESHERVVLVTEAVEVLSKQLDAQVMVVGAGQSALTPTSSLNKLMDRFTVRITLSDNDVETVTRKVLLQKQPSRINAVQQLLAAHAGEISRQLQGTKLGERPEDQRTIADDYPLLPVRRRFWEECFRQIDTAGTQSQLRSQLRIIHDAVAKMTAKDLGAIVPGEELYEALAPDMVNTGVLPRELNEKVVALQESHGLLARRVAGLVFLIGRLPQREGADLGVRATAAHIGDLLVDDLAGNNGKLRADVAAMLERLAADGVLLQVGDEYRLQTREGAEWDREFRARQQKYNNDDAWLQIKREELLHGQLGRILGGLSLIQGAAKVRRSWKTSRETAPPPIDEEGLVVWVQDGWSSAEKEILAAARQGGTDDPRLFLFIPRQAAEDLKKQMVEAEAAEQTLAAKGNPASPEGQEARIGMETRRNRSLQERDRLIGEIVGNTKVFQGGGNEVLRVDLAERIKEAAEAGLIRLFPRFKDADSNTWETAIRRAREGADNPFQPVGHTGPVEQHPVAQQVLNGVGTGKTGTEIRKELRGAPFGWPQDAVDAALIALHRTQHLTASHNGMPVPPGQLDQNRIPKTVFRVERATLNVVERAKLRRLFGLLDCTCKSGDEAAKAPDFLRALIDLARSSGGEPPLPASPTSAEIEDLTRLAGNEQLAGIKAREAELTDKIPEWTARRDLAQKRLPGWRLLEGLAAQAQALEAAQPALQQVEAVRAQRLLLSPSDPVPPLRAELAGILRAEIQRLQAALEAGYQNAWTSLGLDPHWKRIEPAEREAILHEVGLTPPLTPEIGTDEALQAALQAKPLAVRATEIDALSGRAHRALIEAARRIEGPLRPLQVERVTLRNEAELDTWLERQRERIRTALNDGPVLIS